MHLIDWLIVAALLVVLFAAAISTARFTRSVSGFLAAERCGGRYLIATANAMAGTGVISLVYWFELHYEVGYTGVWWNSLTEPALIVIALSGWIVYRFRRTRAMTLAQFFEMRYNRGFRVFAGLVACLSGMINFGIFPAVGARFLIALCGLPDRVAVGGLEISTFSLLMALLIGIAIVFTFLGGQIAVMVTDFIQGLLANAVFVVVTLFLLAVLRWDRIAEVLGGAPGGRSLVDPFSIGTGSEFDLWYFLIAVFIVFYTFNGWQGTQGYQCCAKDPHEAKMANILYGWRFRVLLVITVVAPIAIHTLLAHPDFAAQAAVVNDGLAAIDAPPEQRAALRNQLRTPLALAVILPTGLLGLLVAAILAAFISTHDTYLHSWGSIFVQDVILPFRRRPLAPRAHLWLLRASIFGVAVFIYCFSLLVYKPTQFIAMFVAITGAVFVAGAGAAIIGGLYWKRGTTAGAFAAMITGMTLATIGVVVKQVDAEVFIANLQDGQSLAWSLGLYVKEGLTGQELTFWAIVLAVAAYVVASLLSPAPRVDMDRVLHRGAFAVAGDEHAVPGARGRRAWLESFGIDREFTRGDMVVAAVSVGWPVAWTVLLVVVSIWDRLFEWPESRWIAFWHVWTWVFVAGAAGVTIWFAAGGFRDVRYLFRALRERRADPADDGRVPDESFRPARRPP